VTPKLLQSTLQHGMQASLHQAKPSPIEDQRS
jgi:hypothetical protein